MSIYEPIQNVYGNVETPFIHYYTLTFPKNSRETKRINPKNNDKVKQSELIQGSKQGGGALRRYSSSTANNTFLAPASFQSTVYDLCPHKAILKHIFYSAPNIKENTENMYYIYAKYRHHCLLDLKRRWAANSVMMQCTRFLHRLHGWGA